MFEENKETLFLALKQKNDKIEFEINSTFQNPYYNKVFSLNDLQKISKFFNLFDSIEECFADLTLKLENDNYEINLDQFKEKIIIKFITNIAKKDFNLEIPVKKLKQEKTFTKFLYHYSIKNMNKSEKKNMKKLKN